jgi:hypothetical protein
MKTEWARDHFQTRMLWLAGAFFAGSGASVINYGLQASPDDVTYALVWAILGFMALIAGNAKTSHRFLFSCAFWVTVEFLFYIVLKTFVAMDDIETEPLQKALLASLLFLLGYVAGQWLWPVSRPGDALAASPSEAGFRPSVALYTWLLISFVGFKLLYWVMLMAMGGGDTALDISQATQNQGAGYLFKIPALSQASYFLFLLFAYKHRQYRKTAALMTLVVLTEGVLGAARYSIVTTILINLLLCHLYVRPVRLIYLLLLVPPLVLVVAFFGYIRDIELGSSEVYLAAINTFINERELVFKLFMGRMDMLPQMAEAFKLDELHHLKFEGGRSYVYSLLHSIPRNVWPGKPPLTAAYLTELTKPFVFADGVNIYPSIMIESYINFLWPGTLLIGLVIARFSAWYEWMLRHGSLRAQTFALMAFTFPMSLINEGIHSNIVGTLIYLAAIYALWLALTRLVIGRRAANRLARA